MSIKAKCRLLKNQFLLDIDISIPAKGITALFGHSGCGKTTLLRFIAGLENDPNGFLHVNGDSWQDRDKVLAAHKRRIAYVFQEASLFEHLSVYDNIAYGYKRIPESQRRLSLPQVVDFLGIEPLLSKQTKFLSGGERQRVAIARALAVNPELLLMDEPLTALDSVSKQEILPYLELLNNELDIPIIYVSHVLEEITRMTDYMVLLKQGSVIASGPVHELLTQSDLPLIHDNDAVVIIEARVSAHDDKYHLTYLDFEGGSFSVAKKELDIRSKVKLQVAAKDVSITLNSPLETSILNHFPAYIKEIIPKNESQVTVKLLVGSSFILSRITKKSLALLNLSENKLVYVQAKSVALLA